MIWAWFITSRLGRAIAGAGALIMAFVGVWAAGRRDGTQRAKQKARRDYIETRERMDDADHIANTDDADQFLHDRADKRDL